MPGITGTLQAVYTIPVTKNSHIILDYRFTANNSSDIKETITNATKEISIDTAQSYSNRLYFQSSDMVASHQFYNGKLTTMTGVRGRTIIRKAIPVNGKGISEHITVLLPECNIKYSFSEKASADLNFLTDVNQPDITQLLSATDYTDSLNIFTGNPALKAEYLSSINMGYNFLSIPKKRTFSIMLSYNRTNNKIVNKEFIDGLKRTVTPVNLDGAYTGQANITYNSMISRLINGGISCMARINNIPAITNNINTELKEYTIQPAMKISLVLNNFNTEVNYSYSLNNITLSSGQSDWSINAHNILFNMTVTLPLNIAFNTKVSCTFNNGYINYNNDFIIINAAVSKSFKAIPGLMAKLQVSDLVNNTPNLLRVSGGNYIEDRTVSRLGRYTLFVFAYKWAQ